MVTRFLYSVLHFHHKYNLPRTEIRTEVWTFPVPSDSVIPYGDPMISVAPVETECS